MDTMLEKLVIRTRERQLRTYPCQLRLQEQLEGGPPRGNFERAGGISVVGRTRGPSRTDRATAGSRRRHRSVA